MATINGLIGFHPHMSSLSSLQHKSQVLHITLQYCMHLTPRQRSSFTKIPSKFRVITNEEGRRLTHQIVLNQNLIKLLLLNRHHLPGKVDVAIETVESVTEIVEELAEEVDKVAEQVEDKLPEDAQLKRAVESVEHLAEVAVQKAKQVEDVIHKVKEVEKELEEALITGSRKKP